MSDLNNGDENEVQFPIDFEMVCHGERLAGEMLYDNDVPVDDDLIDMLKYYPGEVFIRGRLHENGFEATELEYNGTTFTPEEDCDY